MPEVATEEDDGDDSGAQFVSDGVTGGFDGVEEDDAEKEKAAKVGTADLGMGDDNGIVSGFDGVEDEQGDDGDGEEESSGGSGGASGDPSIESAIENGLSEAACIGLEGEERDRVYKEMNAIAGKFKVGYFGNRCVQKYLKRDIEDIPPEYGLVAALIAFGAIAVYKRPDGEEQVQQAVSIVKEKMSTSEEPQGPPPEPPRRSADPRPSQQTPNAQPAQQPVQNEADVEPEQPVEEVSEPTPEEPNE